MKVDIAIESIIPDNTAFTVLTALRQLGYAELQSVERAEHVILETAASGDARSLAGQVAQAEVLFNPNKHRMSIAGGEATTPQAADAFEALVRDKDEDNGRLFATLTETFGIRGINGIERAVAWRLIDDRGPANRDRLAWACRVLLANPVSQRYWIRPRPAYLAVALEAQR